MRGKINKCIKSLQSITETDQTLLDVKMDTDYNLEFVQDENIILCRLLLRGQPAPCKISFNYLNLKSKQKTQNLTGRVNIFIDSKNTAPTAEFCY